MAENNRRQRQGINPGGYSITTVARRGAWFFTVRRSASSGDTPQPLCDQIQPSWLVSASRKYRRYAARTLGSLAPPLT